MDRILPLIDYQLPSELGKLIREERALSIKREAMFDELCMLLGVHSVEELLTLVKSGKIGYIHENEERTYELNKLHSLAPKPFVIPKDGKQWYKRFGFDVGVDPNHFTPLSIDLVLWRKSVVENYSDDEVFCY